MRRYEEYKNTGVEWLGEVPSHWKTSRVKDLGNVILGKMLNNSGGKGYEAKFYLKSKNISWLNLNLDSVEKMYFNKYERKQYLLKKNDLLLSEGGEVGKTSIWNNELDECYIQNSVHKITIKKGVPRYFMYLSFSCGSNNYYDSIVNKVSIKHLTYEKLIKIIWINPPYNEQQSIANYLDAKTQAIDKKVSLLEQKIETYKNLKRTLINQTITKGLDKNVPMKDSGISWIGQIPQHWEVKRFKSFADTIKGKNLEVFDNQIEGTLPNLSLEYLRNDSVGFEAFVKTNNRNLIVDENDLIIVWDGAGVGEILNGKVGVISSTIAKLKFNKSVNAKFFSFIRYDLEYRLKQIPTGMGIPHLNPHELKNFMCPIPPKSEQEEVAKYLDHKTATIDAIVGNISKQIETFKQLRKTLINDVVTGKIKVVE